MWARAGQQKGPYSLEDLQRLVDEGSAAGADLVWTAGMPEWVLLSTVLPSANAPDAAKPPPIPKESNAALMPPSLHWAAVLAITVVTLGEFFWVWSIVQARYVKKLDRANGLLVPFEIASGLMMAHTIAVIVSSFSFGVNHPAGTHVPKDSPLVALIACGFFLYAAYLILYWMALFKMRRSIETYYTTVEPIDLRLDEILTFCCGIFYFQHHFTRIAQWKETGVLEPQIEG
jgi:hypothetical protein